MVITDQFITDPHPCAYLPGRVAELEYSIAPELESNDYEKLMNLGFRKFGLAFFRPVCAGCNACRPIRFEATALKLDRSQRRTLKRNAELQVRAHPPVCDAAHMDLFKRYHDFQRDTRSWPQQSDGLLEYEESFVRNQIPALEIGLWEDGKLRGVMLTELTPTVVSAVYHYYDPDLRERGLGTLLILQCAELARQLERRWVYLGYYVEGSACMAYKGNFRPCEVLGVDGVWRSL